MPKHPALPLELIQALASHPLIPTGKPPLMAVAGKHRHLQGFRAVYSLDQVWALGFLLEVEGRASEPLNPQLFSTSGLILCR